MPGNEPTSLQRFSKLSESLTGAIYQFQMFDDGRICFPYASAGFRDIFEVKGCDIAADGEDVFDRVLADDFEGLYDSILQSKNTQKKWHYEFRVDLPQKGIRWLRGESFPEQLERSVLWHGHVQDITELKQFSTELALNEAKFKFIAENTSDGIIVFEKETVSYISPAYQKLFGHSDKKKLKANGQLKFIHPDDIAEVKKIAKNAVAEKKESYKVQYRWLHDSTSYVWRDDHVNLIYGKDGEPLKTLVIARDISEQKKLEESLKKTLDLLEETNQVARVGGWELEIPSGKLNWTSVTLSIHEVPAGYEPELQSAIRFYKEGENRDTFEKLLNLAVELGVPFDTELQIVTAKGNEKWVRTIGKATMATGQCIRVYGTFQDITEQRIQKMQIKQSEQRYRSFIENSLTAFILGTESGVIEEANEAAVKMFGYTEKELKKIGRFKFIDYTDPGTAAFFEKRKQEGKNIGEIVGIRKNGERFFCDAYSSVFHGASGEKMYSTFLIDITERKKQIQTVEQQYNKLRQIGWHQSHVVRGPLARMMGMINLFQYDEIDHREQTIFLNYILEAANELDTIIKKIVYESNEIKA